MIWQYILTVALAMFIISWSPQHRQPLNTSSSAHSDSLANAFEQRIIKSGLSDPWSISYGPDGFLWITESKGYRISRVNSETGEQTVLLDLSAEKNFPRYDKIPDSIGGGKRWPQGGLTGLALHPDFAFGKPYLYTAYAHTFEGADKEGDGCELDSKGCFFKMRIVRYTYDSLSQKLHQPKVLYDSIPGSNDHNGGRLAIAPVNGKAYLFYTVGDMGAGQYNNAGRTNYSQDPSSYEGKILRFNLEADEKNIHNPWIPSDNPFNDDRQYSAVWSIGHRNPQGLAYANLAGQDLLYSSEHGPLSDDEVNLIEKGMNYGHPLVIGYADGNYDGLAAGVTERKALPGRWNTSYPLIEDEKEHAKKIGRNYRDPLYSFYPSSNEYLRRRMEKLAEQHIMNPEWSSIAPSSIAVYTNDAIPGWKNSLLITSLKMGRLMRLKLSSDGKKIIGEPDEYFKDSVRYRDLALSPDGKGIYLITDSSMITSGPTSDAPRKVRLHGAIVLYHYK